MWIQPTFPEMPHLETPLKNFLLFGKLARRRQSWSKSSPSADRLRSVHPSSAFCVASCSPSYSCGASLPWPFNGSWTARPHQVGVQMFFEGVDLYFCPSSPVPPIYHFPTQNLYKNTPKSGFPPLFLPHFPEDWNPRIPEHKISLCVLCPTPHFSFIVLLTE